MEIMLYIGAENLELLLAWQKIRLKSIFFSENVYANCTKMTGKIYAK